MLTPRAGDGRALRAAYGVAPRGTLLGVVEPSALVVGGSGMLSRLVGALAERGRRVGVVARDRDRITRLVNPATPGSIVPLPCDYRDTGALTAAVASLGPVDLAVLWIHGTAPRAGDAVVEVVGGGPHRCRVVEVVGSAATDPAGLASSRAERWASIATIEHIRVTLGYASDGSTWRWLTDAEISDGVLAAVDHGQDRVVGRVEPWPPTA